MKVAVYAICRNEARFLNNWISNVSDADYVCVLDTGSTDGTYKELQKLQKQNPEKYIVKQEKINPWRFDVARNKSMELIPDDADILVSTDFDELFTTENWCEILKSNWKIGVHNRCHYNYAWSHNEVGEKSDIFVYDKIHTREQHWIFPVHEVLWPVDESNYKENCLDLVNEIMLEHFQDKSKERKYYFDLLKLAVEENPNNPHERMLLAREYLLAGKYKESLEEYLTTLKMPAIDNPEFKNVLLESLGRCADLYKLEKNYDEAIWYCQEFIKEDSTYREPYFLLGEMYNAMKMPTLAKAVTEAGFKHATRKYSWIERANTWLGWGYDILSVSECALKNYDDAIRYVEEALRHEPENIRLLKNYNSILKLKLAQIQK